VSGTDEVGTKATSEIVSAAPKTPAVAELEMKIAELEAKAKLLVTLLLHNTSTPIHYKRRG
jgi:hypothetical protein